MLHVINGDFWKKDNNIYVYLLEKDVHILKDLQKHHKITKYQIISKVAVPKSIISTLT